MDAHAAIVRESLKFNFPQVIHREDIIRALPEPEVFNLVHIITGMRRSGKTYYLFQNIHRLLNEGVPRSHIFYFNFADDRLKPINKTLFDDVVEEYYRQVPEARSEGAYLFLDEVQEIDSWQTVCQRIAEHEKVTLVITGSSSKLSSEEIATQFRGRSHSHEMLPLSFREYCVFKNRKEIPDIETATFSRKEATQMEALYDAYLVEGGFPGVQNIGPEDRIEILQSYVRDVVARDVAERFGREDIALANQVALFMLRNSACELSINNLVEQLQSLGFKVYWEKVNRLYVLFQQAFLIYSLSEYSTMLKPDSTATSKVYAADQGLMYAVSRANQQDIGKRLETAVYLEMRRRLAGKRTEAITSFTAPTTKGEKVDFLIGDALATEPYALFQVSVTLENEKTKTREIKSLEKAMEIVGVSEGFIITLREEETVESKQGTIHIMPAWKWTLSF